MLFILRKGVYHIKNSINDIVFTLEQKYIFRVFNSIDVLGYNNTVIQKFPNRSPANTQRFKVLAKPICPTTTLKVMNFAGGRLLRPKII